MSYNIKNYFHDTLNKLSQSTFIDWAKAYIKIASVVLITGSIIYLAKSLHTAWQAHTLSILKTNSITLLIINIVIILISCVTIPSLAFTNAAFFRYAPKISLFYLIMIPCILGGIKVAFFIKNLFLLSLHPFLLSILAIIVLLIFHCFLIKLVIKEKH